MAEIRIREVPAYKVKQVQSIAASIGITTNAFLKMELGKLLDAYPDEKKNWENLEDIEAPIKPATSSDR